MDLNVNTPDAWTYLLFRGAFVLRYVQFEEENCLKLTLNLSNILKFFVVSDSISVQFSRDFVLSSKTISLTTKEQAMHGRFDLRLIVLELRYVWNKSLDDVLRKRSTVNIFLVGLVCLALYLIVSVCHCRSSIF